MKREGDSGEKSRGEKRRKDQTKQESVSCFSLDQLIVTK